MPDLPTGTVTFLFTDIEGSTRLWQAHPDAMPAAIARHDAILGTVVAANGGVLIKSTGDGILAVFATAPLALAATCAAQQAFQVEMWGFLGGLQVRMALHTGAAELRDGDYFGPPLNRGARLLAAGHGGQILLSAATQELVRDHLPPDTDLRDLGQHRLKDLVRPEHIFQLVRLDLPIAFPPLTTLDARPHNLPVQRDVLIGRERDVTVARDLLLREDIGLVTLTGPGGMGKTRLALQVAAEMLDVFPDGVWVVDLAPVSDPALVIPTIAQTLGVREISGQPVLESLIYVLRQRTLLLVLDNFEQVLSAAEDVGRLLAMVPQLKLLVTSRASLRLSSEHEIPVPPLALPDQARLPAVAVLTQYAAVELFIRRAQAVKPDFQVTNANAPALAELCARLDGLPLAIELAAARSKVLTPQALLGRLGQRLALLTGGSRDLPIRQQTIRTTVDWSYQLLDAAEQVLFARLAVFVAGWTLDAAEAVCNAAGDLAVDVLDGLQSLLDKSLLRQVDTSQTDPDGEPRFQMLETIRAYALERLVATGEVAALRSYHASYYLSLAEAAEQKLREPEQIVWLERLDADHDNVEAVLAWSQAEGGDLAVGLRIVGTLSQFWLLRRHHTPDRWLDTLRPLQPMRASSETEELPPPFAALWARARLVQGMLATYTGDNNRSLRLASESLAFARQAGARPEIAASLVLMGSIQTDPAMTADGIAVARDVGDRWLIAWALYHFGFLSLELGGHEGAAVTLEEGVVLARACGDRWLLAWVLGALGLLAAHQSDYARSTPLLAESVALRRALGDALGLCWSLGWSAGDLLAQGNFATAFDLHEERLAIERSLGNRQGTINTLRNLAEVLPHLGEDARAEALLEDALALARELDNHQSLSYLLSLLGMAAWGRGDLGRAHTSFTESLLLARQTSDRIFSAVALCGSGWVAYMRGDDTTATAYLQESLAEHRLAHFTYIGPGDSLLGLAWVARARGDEEVAATWFGEALRSYQEYRDHFGNGPLLCLVGLAGLAGARKRPLQAARCFGAEAALRQVRGLAFWPILREAYERDVATARAQLDEATWVAAWSEGQAMTLEQTVAYALAEATDG